MRTSIARVFWTCFVDLGVTIVYATIAGLLIVGLVSPDERSGSLLTSALTASLLPISVVLLIAVDVLFRALADRRLARRREREMDRRTASSLRMSRL